MLPFNPHARSAKLPSLILWLALGVLLLAETLLNLTPPITRDALVHHLAIPKLWLARGGIFEMPWAEFSYFPMNIDLLYVVCLWLGSDQACKFVHFAFGTATGFLVYRYLQPRLDRVWALLGMFIFVSTPLVIWLATSAYVDLGMTFFTTGSLLAFLRWREGGYQSFGPLLLSAVCMGLALGCKYNALIAWCFVNLMIVHSFARDTLRQVQALKFGLIFGLAAFLTASPWYVRNFWLTGNPFHPLFSGVFNVIGPQPSRELMERLLIRDPLGISFFQLREILYGESLWQTLLIPLRMFFQGQDDSYRYFQGVLNPILILFLPFALAGKRFRRDALSLAGFALFFTALAYFLTAQQVRYLMPIFPCLAILAVLGIHQAAGWCGGMTLRQDGWRRRMCGAILLAAVIGMLGFNFFYMGRRLAVIDPFEFIGGQETRREFLGRHLDVYPAFEFVNRRLPEQSSVFLVFLGRRGYYLDKPYRHEPSFGMKTVRRLVRASHAPLAFDHAASAIGTTHLLMHTAIFRKYLVDNFSREEIERSLALMNARWKIVFEANGYTLWDMQLWRTAADRPTS